MRLIKLIFIFSLFFLIGNGIGFAIKDFERYFTIEYVESNKNPAKEFLEKRKDLKSHYNGLSLEERNAMVSMGEMIAGIERIFSIFFIISQALVSLAGAVFTNYLYKKEFLK